VWKLREWEGPLQFEDEESGTLMMLPSDLALTDDAAMRAVVVEYAEDQELFFQDFALAYAKLLCLGCPEECNPLRAGAAPPGTVALSPAEQQAALFREQAMHGSVYAAKKLLAPAQPPCDVHALEATSGRNALHKAAFWGHNDMTKFLLSECKLRPDVADCYGDTPLHDAAKFGHEQVAQLLLDAGAKAGVRNLKGQTPLDVARLHAKDAVARRLAGQKL